MCVWRTLPLACLVGMLVGNGGCNGNEAPTLAPIGDKVGYVNSAFKLVISASDPDGDKLKFTYSSDIKDLRSRANFLTSGTSASLSFTPLAKDVGIHPFDFTVTDGQETARQSITIEIKKPAANAPKITEPECGGGKLFDLSQSDSIVLNVVAEDMDSPKVKFEMEEPIISDSNLSQSGNMTAVWTWVPGPDAIAAGGEFPLKISASDGENTFNCTYMIIMNPLGSCDSDLMVVEHTPPTETISSADDISIEASIVYEDGISAPPKLYYSTQEPDSPPVDMDYVEMVLSSGDETSGTWVAVVPNPIGDKEAGSSSDLFYMITTQGNQPGSGPCMFRVPESATYKLSVTNPYGPGAADLCKPCESDNQCGSEMDNCIVVPDSDSETRSCGSFCENTDQCPPSYICGDSELEPATAGGVKRRQCYPEIFKESACQQ